LTLYSPINVTPLDLQHDIKGRFCGSNSAKAGDVIGEPIGLSHSFGGGYKGLGSIDGRGGFVIGPTVPN
jgi:hypothetical protein